MSIEQKIRLRDRREPGHLWADNEIYDVFGDELGEAGIGTYMTLARLCYGASVAISLRSLAAHARMSKDKVARGLEVLIRIGLVIETRAGKVKSVSTYTLTDAKALAREYIRQSVSRGDSCDEGITPVSLGNSKEIAWVQPCEATEPICLTVRQIGSIEERRDQAAPLSCGETDLSQKTQNLSQNGTALNKTQDTRQILPPTPLAGGVREDDADDEGFEAEERGLWEVRNRIEAQTGGRQITWEAWIQQARMGRPKRPAPEPTVDAEFAACASLEAVVALLMHRLGICAARLVPVLSVVLSAEAERSRTTLGEAGYLAWCRYRAYASSAGAMRYSWGPRKFFAEGHWLNPGAWPREKLHQRL